MCLLKLLSEVLAKSVLMSLFIKQLTCKFKNINEQGKALKDKETWQLNTVCDPKLNPGWRETVIKDIIGTIGETWIWTMY